MHVSISELCNHRPALGGAPQGRELFGKLVASLQETAQPTLVYLDFLNIEVASSSFLRESIYKFKTYCRSASDKHYPLIVNCSDEVREEVDFLLKQLVDAMVSGEFANGIVSGMRILGALEEKQQKTFFAVFEAGEINAGMLQERFSSEENIKVNAWNNRLAALAQKGLLIETSSGRTKFYRPLVMPQIRSLSDG